MAEWPDEYIADDGNGLRVLSLERNETRRLMTEEERAMIEEYQRKLPAPAPAASQVDHRSMTERALDEASKLPPDMPIEVGIELEDPSFDFRRMQGASESSRANLIDARRAQLDKSQSAIGKLVATLGGEVLDRMWLVNVVDVRLPAGRLAEVARLPGVVGIGLSVSDGGPDGWTGQQVRAGMMLDGAGLADGKSDFYYSCAPFHNPAVCHDGKTGHHNNTSQRVRIGIIELGTVANNMIGRNHVGWQDTAGGPSRIVATYNCDTAPCSLTTATGTGETHGTLVAWAAAGSIEEGQDPNFPVSPFLGSRTADQRARSGVAKEANLYYYVASDSSGIRRAIDRAVANGVDIINMSFFLAPCDQVDTTTHDLSSINATLRNAINAGVLPVKSASNLGHDDSNKCTLGYPAWRPHALTVGALGTSAANPDMNTTGMMRVSETYASSRGGARLRNDPSGPDRIFSGVDLVAPGCVRNYFNNDSNGYAPGGNCGTSWAAPTVAGTAALFRDALHYVGWTATANDARRLLTNMLLFGDAWDADTGNKRSGATSHLSGFGRLHAHWPSTNNLTAPWGWGSQTKHINQGEVLTWTVNDSGPENPAITQWKWALTWFDDDLSNASNIVINVVDTCVSGLSVGIDWSYDYRKRVHLRADKIANRCLEMRAWALKTPPGGINFFTADYYHSGNADEQH